MTLHVWSGVAEVVASIPGPGRLELYAVKNAGEDAPLLVVEAYDETTMVVGGAVAVWDLNQAIAALISESIQARRLSLRDDGRHHGGHIDVIADGPAVEIVASSDDGERTVTFRTTAVSFAHDLNALVKHYLALTRTSAALTIVLPDAAQPETTAEIVLPELVQPSARAALTRPAP